MTTLRAWTIRVSGQEVDRMGLAILLSPFLVLVILGGAWLIGGGR